MSSQYLYEQWTQRVEDPSMEQGVKQTLVEVYEARFGAIPHAILVAIEATHGTTALNRLAELIGTRSAEEITSALRVGSGY